MGPYALRSINAHFKLWDDGVQDSFTENLKQSSVIPNITSSCTCNPIKGACGTTGGGTGSCGPSQREWDYNCNPIGCNGAASGSYCLDDTSCCTTYSPQGCGPTPVRHPAVPVRLQHRQSRITAITGRKLWPLNVPRFLSSAAQAPRALHPPAWGSFLREPCTARPIPSRLLRA